MPTYQYACNDCGEQLEVVQKFTDDALTVCPSCEGNLRKVFSAVGIVFKGSGFYKTDSRSSTSGASTSSAASSSSSTKPADSSSKSSESKSGDSGSSAPAPAPAAASN
ncbi:FmdB family zinc ribbon protein [Nonomuraea sp. B10E15]|uniref:FmdB family zinc ribbon protein n=1 Tax=unclassified Nonomuraea TaxID=2593643 RepID=UPI00325D7305